jgi:probable F420-dependent oxidoreductase
MADRPLPVLYSGERPADTRGTTVDIGYSIVSAPPPTLAELAPRIEELGYDSLWTAETQHDPFISLALAGPRTRRLTLGTGVAVALARNPMNLAMLANDLHLVTDGRFAMGLGSQIKAHITRRFSMPWDHPAARMREYILAVRAIWHSFATGERLRFRGEFYRHTLLVPYFDPGPNPYGNPPIYLASVGPLMTEVAGEVADGLVMHSVSTREHYQQVTLPAVQRGRAKAGKPVDGFAVLASPIVAFGTTEEELRVAVAQAKQEIAYYTSTPSYAHLLELHGLHGLKDELHRLMAEGRFDEMADAVDDTALRTFASVGEPAEAARQVWQRYGDVATHLTCHAGERMDPASWVEFHAELVALRDAQRQVERRPAEQRPAEQRRGAELAGAPTG